MKINLWYSDVVDQWRWVIMPDDFSKEQQSGNKDNLRDALLDIEKTIEYHNLKS